MSVVVVSPHPSHSLAIGYLAWIFGIFGAHRFYYGKPWTGLLWACTGGLLLIGWIVDFFLIERMHREASGRYAVGPTDYTTAWLLATIPPLGPLGIHHFYQGHAIRGALWLLTGGLCGLGLLYDAFTLNEQVDEENRTALQRRYAGLATAPLAPFKP